LNEKIEIVDDDYLLQHDPICHKYLSNYADNNRENINSKIIEKVTKNNLICCENLQASCYEIIKIDQMYPLRKFLEESLNNNQQLSVTMVDLLCAMLRIDAKKRIESIVTNEIFCQWSKKTVDNVPEKKWKGD
jgi:hypothetical protein